MKPNSVLRLHCEYYDQKSNQYVPTKTSYQKNTYFSWKNIIIYQSGNGKPIVYGNILSISAKIQLPFSYNNRKISLYYSFRIISSYLWKMCTGFLVDLFYYFSFQFCSSYIVYIPHSHKWCMQALFHSVGKFSRE